MRENTFLEIEEEIEEQHVVGWRNLYMLVISGNLKNGDNLWENKEKAEVAAARRYCPEESEYLGAFPELVH